MPTDKDHPSPGPSGKAAPNPASRLTWWLTAGSVLAVGAVVAAVVLFFAGDDHTTPDPARVAELEASAEERNLEQVQELVDHTRAAHEELVPVVENLDAAVPPDGSTAAGEAPGTEEIDSWLATVQQAAGHFEDVPSGDTGYNVTHAGLANAVDLLGSAVVAYSNAQLAEDAQRAELLELAGDLRTQAVRAWSVAATQLDMASVESGHGHVHLYLPAAPGSGALEPDGAEEGAEEGAVSGNDAADGHDDH